MADLNMKNIICGPPEIDGPLDLSYSEYLYRRLKDGGNATGQISNSTGQSATYAEILQKSVNMAVSLKKIGVKKGDVIALSCENRFEFTVCAIGIMFAGAVNATLNVLYSRDELIHAMNISKPKMIFCSQFTVYNIIDAVTDISSVQKLIYLEDDDVPEPDMLLYSNLVKDNVNVNNYTPEPVGIHDPLVILCSSGTTGLPKGVVLTHHNFTICNGHLMDMLIRQNPERSKCLLLIMPWFHAYGFITHLICLNLHMKYVFMVRFEEEAFLKAIQDYKVTISFLVPPLMVFLAKHPLVDKFDLSSMREIWCGAAPLSKELQLAVTKRIGLKSIKQAYGLTETTLAVTHSDSGASYKYGSCGQVVPGTKIKVIDLKTGEPLGPNQEGELCFKGPMMMAGYIGDAASTNNIFDSQGWLHSGDVGYYDEDYFFYIVDRLKELIKYKAFQVPPAELEALLLQHPGVKDTGVVGLPDEEAGELPLAFVVKQNGANVTEKDIQVFVASKVSPHKRLRGGVIFVDEIPKNPSGKILRRELRDLLKKIPKSKL